MTFSSIAAGAIAMTKIEVTVSPHRAAAHHGSRSVTVQPRSTLSSISQRMSGTVAGPPPNAPVPAQNAAPATRHAQSTAAASAPDGGC